MTVPSWGRRGTDWLGTEERSTDKNEGGDATSDCHGIDGGGSEAFLRGETSTHGGDDVLRTSESRGTGLLPSQAGSVAGLRGILLKIPPPRNPKRWDKFKGCHWNQCTCLTITGEAEGVEVRTGVGGGGK